MRTAILLAIGLTLAACGSKVCNTQTCSGCCDSGGNCVDGIAATACGTNGVSCTSCQSPERCVNGVCRLPVCSAASCSGCCTANDACESGQDDFACGLGGAVCAGCSGTQHCDGGACM
jgi:hypothetical protein